MKLENIHKDDRGSISIITGDIPFDEITIFKTFEGYARGGCIHKSNDETCYILSGEVLYCIGDTKKIFHEGESVIIPKNTPHYFVAHTDSIVLEYGASPEEKKIKHSEFRKVVDKINELKEEWDRGMQE